MPRTLRQACHDRIESGGDAVPHDTFGPGEEQRDLWKWPDQHMLYRFRVVFIDVKRKKDNTGERVMRVGVKHGCGI